jgi:hypothetical protein
MNRGRIQGGMMQGMSYPSPFFDVAHTYFPATFTALFRWCRYYFLTNPLMNAVAFKMSEYPVTDISVDHPDKAVKDRWTELLQETLRYRAFQIESGLDYHVYGNSLTTLSYPLVKFLKCQACNWEEQARNIRQHWTFTSLNYRLSCPKCGHTGDAAVSDIYPRNASAIRLLRWNVEDVNISYNPLTGEELYFYNMPATLRSDITMGRKEIVDSIPKIFVQALREQKSVILNNDRLHHLRRPTLANQDRGWGIPPMMCVLKDAFYLQVMKKAQECVAPETLLETPLGLRRAADLEAGDLVRSHTGVMRHITAKQVRPMVPERGDHALKISVSGLRQLPSVVSNNHPMYVLRRNDVSRRIDTKEHRRSSVVLRNPSLYEFKFVDADELEVGQYVGYPTTRVRECTSVDLGAHITDFAVTDKFVYSGTSLATAQAFEQLEAGAHVAHDNAGRAAKRALRQGRVHKRIERVLELDEDLAYIAGWYLGDGSIGKGRVEFSMGPDDDGVELEQAIERVFGCVCTRHPSPNSRGWGLTASETLFSGLMHTWISGHAKTKRVPKEIMEAPDAIVLAFLRGYLEADGYTAKDGKTVAVCCANGGLVYQLYQLLLSLRCIATVSERESYAATITDKNGRQTHLEAGRPTFHLTLKTASARRLVALMAGEDSAPIESGKSGFFLGDYFAARINSIEEVPCEEVISFEVEEEHTFCLPGMATHNSILLESIVPLRILYPQAGSGSSDPYVSTSLIDWRDAVAGEIAQWRRDPNYIPIVPLPIGNQTIGGDGKALLLTGEMQSLMEVIINGLGVPKEFIFGGAQWSGTQVSMRMVENAFLGYIQGQRSLLRKVVRDIAAFMSWPEVNVRFRPFKMVDDLQRKAFNFQLQQANIISKTTLAGDSDFSLDDELELIDGESAKALEATRKSQMGQAMLQGEMQLLQMKQQAKAQQAMAQAQQAPPAPGEPGGMEQGGVGSAPGADEQAPQELPPELQVKGPGGETVQADQSGIPQQAQSQLGAGQNMNRGDLLAGGAPPPGAVQNTSLQYYAQSEAARISALPPDQQQAALTSLRVQSPELADMVKQLMAQGQQPQAAGGPPGASAGVDMRPMPEKLPPRRQT